MTDRDRLCDDPWWVPLLIFAIPIAVVLLASLAASDHGCAEWMQSTVRGCV